VLRSRRRRCAASWQWMHSAADSTKWLTHRLTTDSRKPPVVRTRLQIIGPTVARRDRSQQVIRTRRTPSAASILTTAPAQGSSAINAYESGLNRPTSDHGDCAPDCRPSRHKRRQTALARRSGRRSQIQKEGNSKADASEKPRNQRGKLPTDSPPRVRTRPIVYN